MFPSLLHVRIAGGHFRTHKDTSTEDDTFLCPRLRDEWDEFEGRDSLLSYQF